MKLVYNSNKISVFYLHERLIQLKFSVKLFDKLRFQSRKYINEHETYSCPCAKLRVNSAKSQRLAL